MAYLFMLMLSLSVHCSLAELLFFPQAPRIEPAKLEINGYTLENAESGLLVDEKQISRHPPTAEGGLDIPQVQQRFLGLNLLGLGNKRLVNVGRTQTILETTTKTSVVVPLCILCKEVKDPKAGPQVTTCGGAFLPPTACAASRKRRSAEGFLSLDHVEQEPVDPSRVIPVLASQEANLLHQGRSGRTFNIEPSIEERQAEFKGRDFGFNDGFQFIAKSTVTVMTTVTGTLTAQVQVGGLNCLPTYLTSAPYCTAVGQ